VFFFRLGLRYGGLVVEGQDGIKRPHALPSVEEIRAELRGRDLMCWCPLPAPGEPDHCHAAVLLELANAPATAGPESTQ
ncbi:MAG TPA: DUF4326 domain-containing protein, partial [Streptomyces sp.]|nr:DUF4326 domain-containing protein [Streptomyces sp.]